MKNKILLFIALILFISEIGFSQCFPTQPKTAAFATGGASVNKNQVLWLTWGSTSADLATNPHGKTNVDIVNGAGSYASIDVGGGRYLCVEAKISNISSEGLLSYAPGDYWGDSMDDQYNIGGTDTYNKLVAGLKNKVYGGETTFTITCKATLDGVPVKLYGMVMADAESLAGGESISTNADGKWNVIELKKNLSATDPYDVRKVDVAGSTNQIMEFVRGNDNRTAAIAFCTFNPTAFKTQDYEISFNVRVKGGGHTAIALGVLPPGVDGGDAPQSYGNPLHLIERVGMSSDGITSGAADGPVTNLNVSSYNSGSLVPPTAGYLGSVAPDMDVKPLYSKDANGDNIDGIGNLNEEDSWPINYRELTYNVYKSLTKLNVTIPYVGDDDFYISAWVDFNSNGIFDSSERVDVSAPKNQTSVNLSWNIPSDVKFRTTYMRIRYAKNRSDILSPTSYTPGGEIEDFRLRIMAPAVTNPALLNRGKSIK